MVLLSDLDDRPMVPDWAKEHAFDPDAPLPLTETKKPAGQGLTAYLPLLGLLGIGAAIAYAGRKGRGG